MCAAVIGVWWAAYVDYSTHKIPNTLTVSIALFGLLAHTLDSGLTGLLLSLAGLAAGMILMLPGYALQATAAGDVKLMAALGSLLGPARILDALIYSIFFAGVLGMALALIAWRTRSAAAPFKRYGQMLRGLFVTGIIIYIRPKPGEAMAERMPLAVPIAIGTTVSILYPLDLLS